MNVKKSSIYTSMACAVALSLASVATTTAQTITLVDGGFEADAAPAFPTAWNDGVSGTGGSGANSIAYAHSGAQSLLIDSTGAGAWSSPNVDQTFAATAGQLIDLQGWMLNPTVGATTDGSFGLFKIEFLDAGSTILDPNGAGSTGGVIVGGAAAGPFFGAESTPFLTSGSPLDTWVFSQTTAFAPVGTASVRLLALNVNQGLAPSSMYFDDISASVIPEPTTFALAGLGAAALLIFRRRS